MFELSVPDLYHGCNAVVDSGGHMDAPSASPNIFNIHEVFGKFGPRLGLPPPHLKIKNRSLNFVVFSDHTGVSKKYNFAQTDRELETDNR